ncbi:lactonase family protein [Acidicapsa acidisoli]|uniref:lactonase family protein n=1 Tax=Acidicapsa acidisoli TaxID=1615681 RepID=UPI0021DF5DEA|nr:lactonase family protein [Acidicapsa acidisoli]
MKTSLALLTIAGVGISGLQSAHAAYHAQTPEYVYVESNIKTPNGNSIEGFVRGANGQLTPIPGSPFLTGGAGTQYTGVGLGPQDSDQNIVTNQDNTLLFAVNSGSDTIAVFHIGSNGALTPVEGSPFPSGGNDPVSIGFSGNTLFVVNKSGDFGRPSAILPNYTMFRVSNNGQLITISDTANDSAHHFDLTVSVAVGASPSQAYTVPGTNLLFGDDFLGGLIQRFQFDWGSGLHQLSPLALPASEFSDTTTPRLPLGLTSHPRNHLLYVGFVTENKLGVYEYGSDGSLKFLRAVPNSGQAICWLRTNRAGTRLYSTDTGTNSVSVYDISDPAYPREIQNLVLSGQGNVLQFSLSTDEQNLYALSSRGATSIPEGQGNLLHVLSIEEDGTVQETESPIVFNEPNDTRPQGVAVVPAN